MNKKVLLAAVLPLLFVLAFLSLGYFGKRNFERGIILPPVDKVVASARSLRGALYDPFMGKYNNIGANLGFMVCSDVPNIAYGLQGYSWQRILKNDFAIHAKAYSLADNNTPSNPYFHRRARNLYSYFKANKRLKLENYTPAVGDLVFYKKSKAGYIAHVSLVTEVSGKRYRVLESAPKTIFVQEVEDSSPLKRGWIFAGFGSVY